MSKKVLHACAVAQSCQTLCEPMDCQRTQRTRRLPYPCDFSDKNTGMSCHFLLQGISHTRGLSLHLRHWQADSLPLSHLGSPTLDNIWMYFDYYRWEDATGILWMEAKILLQCPRKLPTTKNYSPKNVNSAEVEKTWSRSKFPHSPAKIIDNQLHVYNKKIGFPWWLSSRVQHRRHSSVPDLGRSHMPPNN